LIPALPDIIQYSNQLSAAFVILACDGIWDVMNNEQVAHFVSKRSSNTSIQKIAEQLIDHCLQLESMDNMSIYIIKL
jgi:serine/threonine protein phosphatase PrpC